MEEQISLNKMSRSFLKLCDKNTYRLTVPMNYVRVGVKGNKYVYIDPPGGPSINVGYPIPGTDYIVKELIPTEKFWTIIV